MNSFGDVPQRWWWLSFADPELPEGSQFLGVAIVKATELVTATLVAHMHGCNPGGQVLGQTIPNHLPEPPPGMTYRLLTKAEAESIYGP